MVLQGVTALASHKQVFWFKAGSVLRGDIGPIPCYRIWGDKGPFLAVFDQLLLKGSAVMSITENSMSVTALEMITSSS